MNQLNLVKQKSMKIQRGICSGLTSRGLYIMARVIQKLLYRLFSSLENIHWFTKVVSESSRYMTSKKGRLSGV